MDWKVEKTVTVKTRRTGEIDADMLRKAFGIPKGAAISITVPGGGDWSHCELDLDHYGPIHVAWSEETEKTE